MEIKASDVKALRDKTGAGMMECKKALVDSNGDAAAAEKLLKEKGLAAVAKRSDRATGEGRVFIKQDGGRIAIVEVTCETDFVAKNVDFIALGEKLAELTLAKGCTEVTQEHNDLLQELAVKIRENMAVRRLTVVDVPENAAASTYVHHNFKIGSVVVIKGSADSKVKDFAHECCLHLAANTPSYITKEEVPQSYIDEQTEIFKKQMAEDPKVSSKPEAVQEGILKGKIGKHLSEICFMDQMFIDDEKKSVSAKLAEMGKDVGASLEFGSVVLYVLGK
ncbi:MAG: translation elongation factor Ts [Treponemataceae bacterium]|nr:translation elongation factor Ts [Treponemataceae bacterium]